MTFCEKCVSEGGTADKCPLGLTSHPCVERALARLAELEALVAKLPKTADGVPVVPGVDAVYHPKAVVNGKLVSMTAHLSGMRAAIGTPWLRVEDCYSTEAAARAAGGENGN